MVDLYFFLAAVVLFTLGFWLVKRGNPYRRGGGDPYTKRRMYRMLGWGMWTVASALVVLSLIGELMTDSLPDTNEASAPIRPEIASIRTKASPERIFPNLLTPPSLQADAASGASTTQALPTGSLTLASIQQHQESIIPTLLPSIVDQAPAGPKRTSDFTVNPETELAHASAPAPASGVASAPAPVSPTATASAPSSISPPPVPVRSDAPIDPDKLKQLDAELAAADGIVKKDPANLVGYLQRGNAYGNERKWDLARRDYQKALQLDPKCITASFNIAELDFMQGRYDAARPGFLVMVNDADFGDLSKYKVFLCDLFGGHEQTAAKELAAFNQVGSDASYYFANVAWSLYHKKSDDAQNWWESATQIFAPDKVNLYAKPLIDLGYINVTS